MHSSPRAGKWFLGRRLVLGYALNKGIAARGQVVKVSVEGHDRRGGQKESVIPFDKRNLASKGNAKVPNLLFDCSDAAEVFSL